MTSALTWPSILTKLIDRTDLTRAESSWVMGQFLGGETPEPVMAGFMTAMRAKGETVAELSGLVDAMLLNSVKLDTGSDAVDIVGTGGDLIGTVNISSMASIVVASAGIPVLKHGSRSASGKTGSSEMLEALGIRLDQTPEQVAEVFRKVGITFFFAPVFHPAMRFVGPVRKALGVPTTFNFLGPLANPVQPIATSLGVSNATMAPLLAQELAARGRTGLVFRGNDGLDELSTVADSQIWQVVGGEVQQFGLQPTKLGLAKANVDSLLGGDAVQNAAVARDLFAGESSGNLGAIKDIVLLNAAGGVVAYELAKDPSRSDVSLELRFEDALQKVTTALESGAAAEKVADWVAATA
ncbi:anthranilate phosphoribosyltransferase [Rhodoluna limnophila]|uniref:anthranilate phosphoribosyltransferase n=1 Tax=Rhodoluna limnophila TaxID=232537 RepID=UPI001105D584|nr:anthranilate phosphoribosyltransferase [Rhodoluna limnophila]